MFIRICIDNKLDTKEKSKIATTLYQWNKALVSGPEIIWSRLLFVYFLIWRRNLIYRLMIITCLDIRHKIKENPRWPQWDIIGERLYTHGTVILANICTVFLVQCSYWLVLNQCSHLNLFIRKYIQNIAKSQKKNSNIIFGEQGKPWCENHMIVKTHPSCSVRIWR